MAHERSDQHVDEMPFEAYLHKWASIIRDQQVTMRDIIKASVVLNIRNRGVTVSDMVSRFGTLPSTESRWINYNPMQHGEVHPINIVQPMLRTNTNACLQANAQIEVSAANENARHKEIAQRWQRIADVVERDTFQERERTLLFDSLQKGGTCIYETYTEQVDWQDVPAVLGEANVSMLLGGCGECGWNGAVRSDDVTIVSQLAKGESESLFEPLSDDEREIAEVFNDAIIECPECKCEVAMKEVGLTSLMAEDDAIPVYEVKTRRHDIFNFVVDQYNAKFAGMQSANWLQTQRLRSRAWMDSKYPNAQITGNGYWGYATRCEYGLATSQTTFFNYGRGQTQTGMGADQFFIEERCIWLAEDSYSNYRSPSDYEYVDCDGNVTWSIKAGETIAEAQERLYGRNYGGFKYYWADETLLMIPAADVEYPNFRQCFTDAHFLRDSASYLSSPNYSVVYLQDDLTLLNTLETNIIARNSVNQVLYDSTAFEQTDFSKEYIGTKNAMLLPDFDVRKAIMPLPVPTPTPYISQKIQLLLSIKDDVTQVTPAMRGEAQKGTPYAAQRQQLEQSYGNLTSVLKSFAECKVNVFKNAAKLIKQKWTKEQFQRVGSLFGEHWSESDVNEMVTVDLDRDLIVTYRQGTEMPATPLTKELRFFNGLQQLLPLLAGLSPEIGMSLVKPEAWMQIVAKIDEYSSFEFDLTGQEIDEVLSQKRFMALQKASEPYVKLGRAQLEEMRAMPAIEGVTPEDAAMMQEQGQEVPTKFDELMESVFREADIGLTEHEDWGRQIAFYIEQCRTEAGKPRPNEVLIAALTIFIGELQAKVAEIEQAEQANSPETQALALEQERLKQEQANKERDAMLREKEMDAKIEGDTIRQAAELAKIAAQTDDGETQPPPVGAVMEVAV